MDAGNLLYDIDEDLCTFEIGDENSVLFVDSYRRYESNVTNQYTVMHEVNTMSLHLPVYSMQEAKRV